MDTALDGDAMPVLAGDRSAGGAAATTASRRAGTSRDTAGGHVGGGHVGGGHVDGGHVGGDATFSVDARPGLAALSARAGEALGSYVTPTAAQAASSASAAPASTRGEVGAVLRAPTAAQEMVQTGRPSGRHGGGELEIPAWFEAAARRMFDTQSSGPSDGISMADLTLIQTAPSNQIAASTRSAPAAAPAAPASASAGDAKGGSKVDVEKLANEIYQYILVMMDAARARNGEPYL
jgi:hypothetical protein